MGKNTFKKSLLKRDDQIPGSVIEGFTKSDNLLRSYITRDLGGLAYTLYMTLLSHRNTDTGECFPSAQLLASEIGKTRQYVFKLLSQLEEANYIEIDSGNSKESNHYYFPGEDFYKGIITAPTTPTKDSADPAPKNNDKPKKNSQKKTASPTEKVIPLESKVKPSTKATNVAKVNTPTTPVAKVEAPTITAKEITAYDLDDLGDFEF